MRPTIYRHQGKTLSGFTRARGLRNLGRILIQLKGDGAICMGGETSARLILLAYAHTSSASNELAKWHWCVRITLLACKGLKKNIACASTSAPGGRHYLFWMVDKRALGIQYWLGRRPNVFIEWVHHIELVSLSRCLLHFYICSRRLLFPSLATLIWCVRLIKLRRDEKFCCFLSGPTRSFAAMVNLANCLSIEGGLTYYFYRSAQFAPFAAGGI